MKKNLHAIILAIVMAIAIIGMTGCNPTTTTKATVSVEDGGASKAVSSGDTSGGGAVIASNPGGTSGQSNSSPGSVSSGRSTAPAVSSSGSPASSGEMENGYWKKANPIGTATTIDDKEKADTLTLNKFTYTGNWASSDDPAYFGGSNSWIWQPGAFFEIKFKGIQFELITDYYSFMGIFYVYIDGKLTNEVDQWRPGWTKQQMVYRSPVLEPGEHTIKVVNSSKQNPKCSANEPGRSCTAIDRVIVYAAP